MEKTSILDFISRLTGASAEEDSAKSEDRSAEQPKIDPAADRSDSFMRSYNPFTAAESERRQITSPRATKPPKSTIDLKSGKNLASEKKNDGSSDMIRFINRHNALSGRIGKKSD